jgi:hypothetical protein
MMGSAYIRMGNGRRRFRVRADRQREPWQQKKWHHLGISYPCESAGIVTFGSTVSDGICRLSAIFACSASNDEELALHYRSKVLSEDSWPRLARDPADVQAGKNSVNTTRPISFRIYSDKR